MFFKFSDKDFGFCKTIDDMKAFCKKIKTKMNCLSLCLGLGYVSFKSLVTGQAWAWQGPAIRMFQPRVLTHVW